MRLDKFLKVTGLIKRRSVAKESAEEGVVYINKRIAKPGLVVKAGDILEIDMYNYYKEVEILDVPNSAISKNMLEKYIRIKQYITK